jgi:hypothetical protein
MSFEDAFYSMMGRETNVNDEAWSIVLAAVQSGEVSVDYTWGMFNTSLLHYACRKGSVSTVRRLLNLGASPSLKNDIDVVAMHYAIVSWWTCPAQCGGELENALEKCKMLPVADLSSCAETFGTPLRLLLAHLARRGRAGNFEFMQLLQWVVNQPECALDNVQGVLDVLTKHPGTAPYALIVQTAMEQRARWSLLRAAWTGAVAGAASARSGQAWQESRR